MKLTGLVSVSAGLVLLVAATTAPAGADRGMSDGGPLATARSLAGQQWHYRAQVDGRGGRDRITITAQPGFSTGAHAQGFVAYTYRPDGELLTLRAPRRQESWFVNSSFGTGTSGWKCTRRGVQARSIPAIAAIGGATIKVKRISYAMGRNGDWRRTKRAVRTVRVGSNGNPPAYLARYARFACPGLPKRVL